MSTTTSGFGARFLLSGRSSLLGAPSLCPSAAFFSAAYAAARLELEKKVSSRRSIYSLRAVRVWGSKQ